MLWFLNYGTEFLVLKFTDIKKIELNWVFDEVLRKFSDKWQLHITFDNFAGFVNFVEKK